MKIRFVFGMAFFILAFSTFAQTPEVFSTSDGAIRGYDAVAYFKIGKAIKGKSEFTYQWKGANWSFDSKENLEIFKANPEKYVPQYGGYCAYGLSENHKSPTSPDAFTIVNDKLYLNYNLKVKDLWVKEKEGRISKADSLWKVIK